VIHDAAIPLVVDTARLLTRVVVMDLEGEGRYDNAENGKNHDYITHTISPVDS
jgi:hypothetical protein